MRSCDVMLGFLDVEIGGKKRRKVPGIAFKHIQARCEFFELIVEVIKLTNRFTFFLIHCHGHLPVFLDMMFC